MKQHNHWKLTQLQKNVSKIVLWGFGLIILCLNIKNLNFDVVSEIVSILCIMLGFGLHIVEKKLWKTALLRFPLFENYWTPVLEGRWEGKLSRENTDHDFVVEIKQSFTSISCITYTKHSRAWSYASEILYNDQIDAYKFFYYWNATTSNVQENTGNSNSFDGFTVLEIILDSKTRNVTELKGRYFTNRQPIQTQGEINLKVRQKELKNSF